VSASYFERGGLRWGRSFWLAANATWPFATLGITRESVEVQVGVWPLRRRFLFAPEEVRAFRRCRGLFSVGVQVEHARPDYPPLILFWTFRSWQLLRAVRALGYPVAGEGMAEPDPALGRTRPA
jgi:hypothetical protein